MYQVSRLAALAREIAQSCPLPRAHIEFRPDGGGRRRLQQVSGVSGKCLAKVSAVQGRGVPIITGNHLVSSTVSPNSH